MLPSGDSTEYTRIKRLEVPQEITGQKYTWRIGDSILRQQLAPTVNLPLVNDFLICHAL